MSTEQTYWFIAENGERTRLWRGEYRSISEQYRPSTNPVIAFLNGGTAMMYARKHNEDPANTEHNNGVVEGPYSANRLRRI